MVLVIVSINQYNSKPEQASLSLQIQIVRLKQTFMNVYLGQQVSTRRQNEVSKLQKLLVDRSMASFKSQHSVLLIIHIKEQQTGMKRKHPAKKQVAVKIEEPPEEYDEEEPTPNRRGRQDNSLSVLTKKFIQLIRNSKDATIDLNQAVDKLGVQKRRIYDITNVLQGINYVSKLHKNTIKWIGGSQDPELERDIVEMRRKIDELANEEKRLDAEILAINGQIKENFLENEELKPYHYITFDDCLTICRSISKGDPNKAMLVVSAPKGTSLQVGEEERGDCILKMDTGGIGPIKVFSCKLSEGVKEVHLNNRES